MKQYITVEQVNELSQKGKKRLHDYFYRNFASFPWIVTKDTSDAAWEEVREELEK